MSALVLWGGEDISPSLYGQKPVHTNAPAKPSRRDLEEINLVKEAVKSQRPIIGICRGAQLLCVMHGGKLWQHVENHAAVVPHELEFKLKDGVEKVYSNSTHHQMMIPDKNAEIIATTTKPLYPYRWGEDLHPVEVSDKDIEILYLPKLNALAIQAHPEWMPKNCQFNQMLKQLIEEKFNGEVSLPWL